ncbi:hypothetical protein V6Z54_17325 [Bacillus sp. MAG717A]|uniref:hypothetical protein n=1 Tax=Bacillus TaxID=1386 RepID=UPI0030CFE184
MGLDFTHCEAHWSYSDFHDFRKRLAASIGMNLDDMEGFGGEIPYKNYHDDIIPLLEQPDSDITYHQVFVRPSLRDCVN